MFLRSTDRCQFADVLFRLDDGVLAAHRAILMARCDMMNAMFAHKGRTDAQPNLSSGFELFSVAGFRFN